MSDTDSVFAYRDTAEVHDKVAEERGKLHFFLEILAFFQKIKKLFGKMPRFSPIFWKSDFSKFLIFFFSFGGRLRIMFHASENNF